MRFSLYHQTVAFQKHTLTTVQFQFPESESSVDGRPAIMLLVQTHLVGRLWAVCSSWAGTLVQCYSYFQIQLFCGCLD